MKPNLRAVDNQTVDEALERIERASTHPRTLAKEAVQRHRNRQMLTQEMIDSGYDDEERRKMFVGHSLRFRKRSLFSRLFG